MTDNISKEGLRKIFVGGLNRNTTDDVFRDYFQQFGSIVDIVIIKDSHTKKSKGFGFVTYDSVESADKALEERPHMIDDKEVDIKRAIPREQNTDTAHQRTKKLFVGGLPPVATEDDIIAHFHDTYPEKGTVVKCDLIKHKETGASRGFAFLEMDTEDFADLVIIDNPKPEICGKVVEVKKAEDRRGGDGNGQSRAGGRGGRSGYSGGYSRYDGGNQHYNNDYQSYGNDMYSGGQAGYQNQGGYGNVFYPNVGYGGNYGQMHGPENGGYGNAYNDYGGGYNQTQSGYGPMKGGGVRWGGGSQRGGRPY